MVKHEVTGNRFVYLLGDQEAVLEYALTGSGGVDFYRTYVPPEHRGRGIAETLADAGLAWARSENLAIEASCWYVAGRLAAPR